MQGSSPVSSPTSTHQPQQPQQPQQSQQSQQLQAAQVEAQGQLKRAVEVDQKQNSMRGPAYCKLNKLTDCAKNIYQQGFTGREGRQMSNLIEQASKGLSSLGENGYNGGWELENLLCQPLPNGGIMKDRLHASCHERSPGFAQKTVTKAESEIIAITTLQTIRRIAEGFKT